MRILFLAPLLLAPLAACTPSNRLGQVDQVIADASSQLQAICQAEPLAHVVFLGFASKLPGKVVQVEADAHVAATAACEDPTVSVVTALANASKAYAAVVKANAQAAPAAAAPPAI